MDSVKGRILLKQQISNLKEVGFEELKPILEKHLISENIVVK